jgi:hypothetical protein
MPRTTSALTLVVLDDQHAAADAAVAHGLAGLGQVFGQQRLRVREIGELRRQRAHRRRRRGGDARQLLATRRRQLVGGHVGEREAEAGALAGRGPVGDIAAHRAGDLARDRQAQARAAAGARVRGRLLEGLEDALDGVGRHALAGVAHLERQRLRIGQPRNHADLARGRELDRVADQVVQHLLHAARVVHGGLGQRRVHGGEEDQPALHGHRLEQVGHVAHRLRHQRRLGVERDAVHLDAREIEQVADHGDEVLGRVLHHLQRAVLHRRERLVGHQLRHAEDAVQRCAQLVAHRGEEARLRGIGMLGVDQRALALLGDRGVFEAQLDHLAESLVAALALDQQHRREQAERERGDDREHRAEQQLLHGQRPEHDREERGRRVAVRRERERADGHHAHGGRDEQPDRRGVHPGHEQQRQPRPRDRIDAQRDEEPVAPVRLRAVARADEAVAADVPAAPGGDGELGDEPAGHECDRRVAQQQHGDDHGERAAAHQGRRDQRLQAGDPLRFDLAPDFGGRAVRDLIRSGVPRGGVTARVPSRHLLAAARRPSSSTPAVPSPVVRSLLPEIAS